MSSDATNPDGPASDVSGVVEHLFRHESAKMVATLTRIFGLEHLTLAEDVVQEALIRALRTWPFYGIPKNPAAWIMRASRNLALDFVRRERNFRDKEAEIIRLMEDDRPTPEVNDPARQDIADDTLRMMFVCCHPSIPADVQVALALKTLCSFSATEIGHALLTTEAAIAKRLTRAKQKIREAQIRFEIPAGTELARRLDGVLRSLYLLFNEGYKASAGDQLVREDICHEAIRLTGMLAEHPAGNRPETHALLALMLLGTARIPTRVDPDGHLLRLEEQDRSRWNRPMIARGMYHLAQSATGQNLSAYHLQAGIAACHCAASDFSSTDWTQILELYDRLVELDPSPVAALNRAVAVAQVHGPKAGVQAVGQIPKLQTLESYHLFHAVLGEFELRLKNARAAAAHFRESFKLAATKSEQDFLAGRLAACEAKAEG